MAAYGTEVWASAAWLEAARSWLDEQLAAVGLERTGFIAQPHLRPWATALRVPTSSGTVWMKACGPGTAFEVRLYGLLADVVPARVLHPIAVDPDRGWMILPDGGSPLGERVNGVELAGELEKILPLYAQMQRELTPHASRLLALGVKDMRPAVLPRRFAEAMEAARVYSGRRGAEVREALWRVDALEPDVLAWREQLATAPGLPSIDHNDLHPWNILAGGYTDPDGARFYDWGDAVVAHPFASMLVALAVARDSALGGCADDDPRLLRLRDAYLEPFSDLAPHAELVETLELACRAGKIARALTWTRAIEALDPDVIDDEWAKAPFETMVSLPDVSYLGGA